MPRKLSFWGRLREKVECVIDAHIHLPAGREAYVYNSFVGPIVDAAVALGLPDARHTLVELDIKNVYSALEKTKTFISKYASILDGLEPETLYYTSLKVLEAYKGEPCRHKLPNTVAFYGVPLEVSGEALHRLISSAFSRGARGLKVISTIYFKPLNDPVVAEVFEEASQRDAPIVVHSGCDPGIWELPQFCKYGDPSKLENIIRTYRDVRVVLAHAGSYSALAPGVFAEEALYLARRYSNVYIDISALHPSLVRLIIKAAPLDKVLFGTDYPVITTRLEDYLEELAVTLLDSIDSHTMLERVMHGNAEEALEVKCPYSSQASL